MYVQGCYAGGFDTLDAESWAEVVTVKTDGGAFAGIFNARYGWVESYAHVNTSDGAGQRLHREFWDAIFNPDEDEPIRIPKRIICTESTTAPCVGPIIR